MSFASVVRCRSTHQTSSKTERFRRVEANFSLTSKLRRRQIIGEVRSQYTRGSVCKIFKRLPGRLAFCLKEVVPLYALQAGHIFLGFSKCGQFLLSYTQSTTDFMNVSEFGFVYQYRLHWWLFVPYRQSRKIAETLLFSSTGVPSSLHISVCQWPNDSSKVVVFGYAVPSGDNSFDEFNEMNMHRLGSSPSHNVYNNPISSPPSFGGISNSGNAYNVSNNQTQINCYLTVTAKPPTFPASCKECKKVADSYNEEELAEGWNSCIRLNCLRHALTVHTSFDFVTPYPKFEPRISLKRDKYVIINTGNWIHSLYIDLQNNQLVVNQKFGRKATNSNEVNSHESNSDGTTHFDEISANDQVKSNAPSSTLSSPTSMIDETRRLRVIQFLQELSGGLNDEHHSKNNSFDIAKQPTRLRRISGVTSSRSRLASTQKIARRRNSAKACGVKIFEPTDYDDAFNEEGIDGATEDLNSFRRKRLAERKYEFQDDDEECSISSANFSKFSRSLQRSHSFGTPKSSSNLTSADTKKKSKEDYDVEFDVNKQSDRKNTFTAHIEKNCPERVSAKFTRRFIEKGCESEELITVITDVEEDEHNSSSLLIPQQNTRMTTQDEDVDVNSTSNINNINNRPLNDPSTSQHVSFHTTLPIEVRGSAYKSMDMIANHNFAPCDQSGDVVGLTNNPPRGLGEILVNNRTQKLLKAAKYSVIVEQRSFDLELYCNHISQIICDRLGVKFWFCNDYDVDILDFDPHSGDVICVGVVLVKIDSVKKDAIVYPQNDRRQFQASFYFSWNVDIENDRAPQCRQIGNFFDVVEVEHLNPNSVWHPTKVLSMSIHNKWRSVNNFNHGLNASSNIRVYTNDAVMDGTSLDTILDSEHLVAIIHDKLDD